MNRNLSKAAVVSAAVVGLDPAARREARAAPVIKSIDVTRVGISSDAAADETGDLRASFPDVVSAATHTFTPTFLAGVDYVLFASPSTGNRATVALSPSEQAGRRALFQAATTIRPM